MKLKFERVFFILIVLSFLVVTSAIPVQAKNDYKTFVDTLQSKLDQLCKQEKYPGITLGVVLPNGRQVSLASGYADLETKTPMPVSARIFTGSIGKTYVAAVALQLIHEGKISLSHKISRYLKNEKWFSRLPNANDITVKMLMNHTSGLPRFVDEDAFWKKVLNNPDLVWKPIDSVAFILDKKPVHPAGYGWAYSDTDYMILGMIIERITGNTYYDELQKRVLTPLKLKDTTPAVHRKYRGMVQGYTSENKPPMNLPGKVVINGKLVTNPRFEWCGGGLVTTSTEMAVYMKELLEGRVIPEDVLKLMKQPVSEKTGKSGKTGYGLGLAAINSPQGVVYGHRGTMLGCVSVAQYVPKYKFGIAIQINADGFYKHFKRKKDGHQYLESLKPTIIEYLTETGR